MRLDLYIRMRSGMEGKSAGFAKDVLLGSCCSGEKDAAGDRDTMVQIGPRWMTFVISLGGCALLAEEGKPRIKDGSLCPQLHAGKP